jgi:Mg2+/Co2+ transporter CorC
MSVDDAALLLDVEPWPADAATVGGLVIAELGHLPAAGECVRLGEFELTVERVAGHAVATVIARRVAELREAEG